MKYLGSKRMLTREIWPKILEDLGRTPKRVIEPFMGGANFTSEIIRLGFTGEIIAGDFDPDCTFMWKKVLEGWLPTMAEEPSKEEYLIMRDAPYSEDPLRGFSRVTSAFGGAPWGAWIDNSKYMNYKGSGKNLNFWKNGVGSLTTQASILRSGNLTIAGGSYDQYENYITDDTIYYFDPPYANTRGYNKGNKGQFDSDAMWAYAEELSKTCPVYISELTAPDGWAEICIIEKSHQSRSTNKKSVLEKVFRKSPESSGSFLYTV